MNEPDKPVHIKAVDFRADSAHVNVRATGCASKVIRSILLLLFLVCVGLVWLVLTGPKISVRVQPSPDELIVSGGLYHIPIGDEFLVWPGSYRVMATKEGYEDLEHAFEVTRENLELALTLNELPSRLSVTVRSVRGQALSNAMVLCDNEELGIAPIEGHPLPRGTYRLDARAERYLDLSTNTVLEGKGREEVVELQLVPAWAEVHINSELSTATVQVDGEPHGMVPVDVELMAGRVDVRLDHEGYKSFTTQLMVKANTSVRLDDIKLAPFDAVLILSSSPTGALVVIDGTFVGTTPLTTEIEPDVAHAVRFSTAGYGHEDRALQLGPAETNKLEVVMDPMVAPVRFVVEPDGTELWVDGKLVGPTPSSIELITREHEVEIRKKGYEHFKSTVRPKVGFPQEIKVVLSQVSSSGKPDTTGKSKDKTPEEASESPKLVRIEPHEFSMGSPRREQGRRSNETTRRVKLTRPFLIGTHEVTNKEFTRFEAKHHSGSVRHMTLNRAEQPVVNVRWQDAAAYCNWLSRKEGLTPVYEKYGNRMVAREPIPNGYRLPTEAEWEFVAKVVDGEPLQKYPWGHGFPPPADSGNFADDSVRKVQVMNVLRGVDDGAALTANPGSYKPNHFGLYDLGGNVAEWCHDRYNDYPMDAKMVEDPTGPAKGRFYTIRGSSWRSSGITELRCSSREYSEEARDDVGFRVCRYTDEGKALK